MDAQALKASAVATILATRRTPPRRRYYTDPDTGVQVRREDPVIGTAEFTAAATVAEWCDDRQARMVPGPAGEFLAWVVDAMRQSEDAAVLAVSTARRLGKWHQHVAWQHLSAWTAGPPGTGRLLDAVRAEWKRLGLQKSQPDYNLTPYPELARVGPAMDAPPGRAYSPSVPESMKPPLSWR